MTYLLKRYYFVYTKQLDGQILTENPSTKIRIFYQKLYFGSDSLYIYIYK